MGYYFQSVFPIKQENCTTDLEVNQKLHLRMRICEAAIYCVVQTFLRSLHR